MTTENTQPSTSVDSFALLPCPFCGAKADPEQGFHGLVVIGCSGDCFVNPQTQPFDKYDEAVTAWNKRTDSEDAGKWREPDWALMCFGIMGPAMRALGYLEAGNAELAIEALRKVQSVCDRAKD